MTRDEGAWRVWGDPPAFESEQDGWHVRIVQPYRAVKLYRCPGCDHEIWPRTLHIVAWPVDSPELRRHWHRPCWEREHRALGRRRPKG